MRYDIVWTRNGEDTQNFKSELRPLAGLGSKLKWMQYDFKSVAHAHADLDQLTVQSIAQ